jgi:hypothetical protein
MKLPNHFPCDQIEMITAILALVASVTIVRETLIAADYEVRTFRKSQIDPTKSITAKVQLRCPKCKTLGPDIEHGHGRTCPKCGLHITRWGNSLDCMMEKK